MISKPFAAWLACIAIYGQQNQFDKIHNVGVDVVGLKTIANTLTVTPEGSASRGMWINNFEALPTTHPILGQLHSGFLAAALLIYTQIKPELVQAISEGKEISLQGHSRAGSLVDLIAAFCAMDGIKVTLFMFEAAPVGEQRYVDFCTGQVLADVIKMELSTVNLLDPVPDSDVCIGYRPTYSRTNLNHAPGGIEDLEVIDYHIGSTIYAGVLAMFPNG